MRIRPARLEEGPLLTALGMRSKAVWGYDDAFMRRCKRELTISREYLTDPGAYVADVGERVVGYYALRPQGVRADLEYLFVAPDMLGRGFGCALWRHAVARAATTGARALRVEADPHAQGFYERMGAVPVGNVRSASVAGRWLPVLSYAIV